jgi:hypothetical protein
MAVPEPFATTFTITSTILINIASDIVERHAKDIKGRFAGSLLKWAGLMEPDFDDRLRETLRKALQVFFQTYPQYNLSGIDTFFRDPVVAQQIGDFILDRKPIDEALIQQALDRHLRSDAITRLLMQRRKVEPGDIIPDFLKCYRQILNLQLSIPEMSILLEVMDLRDTLLHEVKASEERKKAFVEELLRTKLSAQTLQAASQASQNEGTAALMQEMETARLVQPDEAVQTIQRRFQALPTLFTDGLCKGRVLHPAPYEYFVSHGFPPDTLADWRKTLTETLAQASKTQQTFVPYLPGDTLMGGYRFCGICEKLYATRFSIFLLPPSQDRNVYLELGIALGMESPFLLIQPREAQIPSILEGLNTYITSGTFRSIRQQLPGQLGKIEEFDFAVVRPAKNPQVAMQKDTYLIAAGNLFDDEDVEGTITDVIKARYPALEAISLSQVAETAGTFWMLEQLIAAIQNARFAIYRVNEHCSPTTFLALGISIALNRPFLLLKETRSEVPLDLRGIALYQFPNFISLENKFIPQHQAFFDKHAQ